MSEILFCVFPRTREWLALLDHINKIREITLTKREGRTLNH